MEFRPNDIELLITCAQTKHCASCTMRIGCPIRYSFYEGEVRTEINIQRAEIFLQPLVGEDKAYTATEFLREKILTERGAHPGGYSYI